MDPFTAVVGGAILLGTFLWGCGSGDDDSDGNGHGDAGDVTDGEIYDGDGIDADYEGDGLEGDADVDDADGGEIYVDCDAAERGCVNDEYASLTIGSSRCYPADIDLVGDKLLGVCKFPVNSIFSCNLGETSGSCGVVADIPLSTDIDGTSLDNYPVQLADLGNNRLIAMYTTEGTSPANGLMLLNATTYEVIQHIALGAITVLAGGTPRTIIPRQPHSALLSPDGNWLYVSTSNFDPSTGLYEQGTVISLPFLPPPAGEFDDEHWSRTTFLFTSGRNTQAMAYMNATNIAVLNAYGDLSEIPSELAPGEVAGASIDIIDVSTSSTPAIVRTVEVGAVKLQNLPEMVMGSGNSRAVVVSAAVPPVVYRVNLDGAAGVSSVTLPDAAELTSIVYSPSTDHLLATSNNGFVYEIGYGTMALGGSVYAGYDAGRSEISLDGTDLYQAVGRPCGYAFDNPTLVDVDVLSMP
jgi:hypothetical protein